MISSEKSTQRVFSTSGLKRILRWTLGLLLIGVASFLLGRDPVTLRTVTHVSPVTLVVVGLLVIANQFLMSLRLGLAVAQCGGRGVSRADWFRLTSVGQFLNLLVPQLGNVYRAWILKKDFNVTYTQYASGLFAFVWLDLIIGILIATSTIAILDPAMGLFGMPALLVLGFAVMGLITLPVVLARVLPLVPFRGATVSRLRERATHLLFLGTGVFRSTQFLGRVLMLNLAMATVQIITLHFVFVAVGLKVSISRLALFQTIIKLSNQVAITPGNLGLVEFAYGLLAQDSLRSLETGLAAGLLMRAIGTITVVALGFFLGGVSVFKQRDELLQKMG